MTKMCFSCGKLIANISLECHHCGAYQGPNYTPSGATYISPEEAGIKRLPNNFTVMIDNVSHPYVECPYCHKTFCR